MSSSSAVISNQASVHPKIHEIVQKHQTSQWQSPIGQPSRDAFLQIKEKLTLAPSIILDSGCGVGESTRHLALQNPSALVVGIDKSTDRLAKSTALPDNALLVRADLLDLWRILLAEKIPIHMHYILYPNPWPKSEHFKRRFHGHPIFPDLIRLCPKIEIRSNWKTYLDEFKIACSVLEQCNSSVNPLVPSSSAECMTPFERKYFLSGHDLWKFELHS